MSSCLSACHCCSSLTKRTPQNLGLGHCRPVWSGDIILKLSNFDNDTPNYIYILNNLFLQKQILENVCSIIVQVVEPFRLELHCVWSLECFSTALHTNGMAQYHFISQSEMRFNPPPSIYHHCIIIHFKSVSTAVCNMYTAHLLYTLHFTLLSCCIIDFSPRPFYTLHNAASYREIFIGVTITTFVSVIKGAIHVIGAMSECDTSHSHLT